MTHTTTHQIFDAVIAANVPYQTVSGFVNGKKVDAWIVPQGRVTTSRKASPRIDWYVDGKRTAKANLATAVQA